MMNSENGSGAEIRPGRTITIRSKDRVHDIYLSPRAQLAASIAALGVLGWTLTASAVFVMSLVSAGDGVDQANAMQDAYQTRIVTLAHERDQEQSRAAAAQVRFILAQEQLSTLQDGLTSTTHERAELAASLGLMRGQLESALMQRNSAEELAEEHLAVITSLTSAKDGPDAVVELADALDAVSDALGSAVRERDTVREDMAMLETEIESLELSMQITAERQERLVAGLEDAVQTSFKPLEHMFEQTGLDVDTLVGSIRSTYAGQGGPLLPLTVSTRGFNDPEMNKRFSSLAQGMDKMNMMRIVATKIPYTMPVRSAYRFTSGFGGRRDPKTGAYRKHNGIDMAGSRGTPIYGTADGVVIHAGRQSGFGNLVKIKHEFGFETLYAHLNKIHVKVGDRVARGDHIGDMGTTGRSTGVHLHYEVRVDGTPVNPMNYIKAGKNVF